MIGRSIPSRATTTLVATRPAGKLVVGVAVSWTEGESTTATKLLVGAGSDVAVAA